MRLYELEAGQKEFLDQNYVSEVVARIRAECSSALTDMIATEMVLYRGFRSKPEKPLFIGMPRADRKTLDSQSYFNLAYEQIYKAKGFKANRNNSIFTTTNFRTARYFGKVFVVLPKNGFDFTWSIKHRDLYFNEEEENNFSSDNAINRLVAKAQNYPITNIYGQTVYFKWNKYISILMNLHKAQVFKLPISADVETAMQFIDLDKLARDAELTDSDFQGALKLKHEIAIHGPYYAMDINDLKCREIFIHLFGPEIAKKIPLEPL